MNRSCALLTTEELLSRAIYDAARSPSENLFVVSAKGIFLSDDGKLWSEAPGFENRDLPVAFDSGGSLFVGSHVSRDGGKTFEPYIHWARFLRALAPGRNVRKLRMTRIIPNSGSLQVEVAAHRQPTLFLTTKDDGRTWQPLNGKHPTWLVELETSSLPESHTKN